MKHKLTASLVKALEPQNKLYKVWDTELKCFFVSVLPGGTKTYMIHYRHEGLGRDYKIGRATELTADKARTLALQSLAKVSTGVDIQADKKQAKRKQEQAKVAVLETFIEKRYGPWALLYKKSAHESLRVLNRDFKHLLRKPMEQISKWDIQKWQHKQLKSGGVPQTINRKVAILKGVLTRAVEWDVLSYSPLTGLKPLPTADESRSRFLSEEEEQRLRKILVKREFRLRNDRDSGNRWRSARHKPLLPNLRKYTFADHIRPMVLLAMTTGMRRGEIFHLKWDDVDLDKGELTLRAEITKSKKSRIFFLADEPLWVLSKWKEQTDSTEFVFSSPETGLPFDNINKAWRAVRDDAELVDFRFHDLRHHYASTLEFMNLPLDTIRKRLGHSSLKMTSVYAHGDRFRDRLQDQAVIAMNAHSHFSAPPEVS
jgi:integrase